MRRKMDDDALTVETALQSKVEVSVCDSVYSATRSLHERVVCYAEQHRGEP
jgi:hypothetical protein